MIDSYLAPRDLAEARGRIAQLVTTRCGAKTADPDKPGTVVRLTSAALGPQLAAVRPETVCVVADFTLWHREQRVLNALAEALHPDRILLFVEPTADLGWRRLLHRYGRPVWRLVLGHHFMADIPAQLRDAGLVVTTTDRFGLGPRGVRTYVWGEAKHYENRHDKNGQHQQDR